MDEVVHCVEVVGRKPFEAADAAQERGLEWVKSYLHRHDQAAKAYGRVPSSSMPASGARWFKRQCLEQCRDVEHVRFIDSMT